MVKYNVLPHQLRLYYRRIDGLGPMAVQCMLMEAIFLFYLVVVEHKLDWEVPLLLGVHAGFEHCLDMCIQGQRHQSCDSHS